MSATGLRNAQEKMRDGGVPQIAIDVFSRQYEELAAGATGLIGEADIDPVADLPLAEDLTVEANAAREALARTVVIKLNGGLATTMGMSQAKSLLPVRDGRSFLDLIVEQVGHARRTYDVGLPLVLMNSFRTHADSLAALERHPDIAVSGLPLDFVQNREPRLLVDSLEPVSWPADPSMEWCPPGHGDLYSAIQASGLLESLLEKGYRYASVSNADNLGASPDPAIVGWFAASGSACALELCRRSEADLKGGHPARRRADGRLVIREIAQTAPEDVQHFTDPHRHPFFNTNNLWLDLVQLRDVLSARGGDLGLPLIRNVKRVDPGDPASPEVYQIESAMGAAIEVFDNATALVVERSRFLPVKTTCDLLLMRSDAYVLGEDGVPRLALPTAPLVDLEPTFFGRIAQFEERFPEGAPSLREARSLRVRGDWTFEAGVSVVGDVHLDDPGQPARVEAGTILRGD